MNFSKVHLKSRIVGNPYGRVFAGPCFLILNQVLKWGRHVKLGGIVEAVVISI